MAERYERYRRTKRKSRLRLPTPEVKKEPTTYDPARQVEGLEKRLEASGVDVEKATDKRSFIEKALNLREDQNFLFDVFEVLGRPQQALFNGINALQKGESFAKGFSDGLTGENFTQFSEILNEAGLGEKDKFGVDDVVGFLGDVFLDPADLAIMAVGTAAAPLTGGTSTVAAAGAVTAANTVADAGRMSQRIIKSFTNLAKKSGDELIQSVKNIGSRIKAGAKTTAKFYGELGLDIVEGSGKKVFDKLFKKSIKLADGTLIRKVGVTDLTMAAFGNLIKKGGKAFNWTVRTGVIPSIAGKGFKTYTDAWDNWLTAIKGQFNAAARLGDRLFIEAQMAAKKMSFGLLFGDAWARKINLTINNVVEDTLKKKIAAGEVIADVAAEKIKIKEALVKDMSQYAEHALETSTTTMNVLTDPNKFEKLIDEKVATNIREAINHPAYRQIKSFAGESVSKGKIYEKQVRQLTSKLSMNQQMLIDELNDQLAKLDPADTARKLEINKQIEEAQSRLESYRRLTYNESGYKSAVKTIEEGIANGNLGDNFRTALENSRKAIDDDSFNLFDELFVKEVMEETGQTVYVLRKDIKRTEKIIEGIRNRAKQLTEIVDTNAYEVLRDYKKFGINSDIEKSVRELIEKSGMSKSFDDIFEISNGKYIVIDEDGYQEIMSLARPMTKSYEGARFITEEELLELRNRFADGFEYQKEYDSVINDMEKAMQWYDRRYGTKFKTDQPGYLRHAITTEAKETLVLKNIYRKQFGADFVDNGEGILLGNTQVFKKRKYDMSIQEANRVSRFNAQRLLEDNKKATTKFLSDAEVELLQDRATMNLFSEYITDSIADTLVKMNVYGSAVNVMNKSLVAGVIADKDILRFTSDSKDIPRGFVSVQKKTLRDKLQKMSNVLVDNADMKNVIKNYIDDAEGAYALIDENVFKMIGRLGEDKKSISVLTKLLEKTNNIFKRTKVFSLGFHFKNLVGNASNLFLAGVPILQIPGMLFAGIKARRFAAKNIDLFARVAEDTSGAAFRALTKEQQKYFTGFQVFTNGGFNNAGKKLFDLDELMEKTADKHLNATQKIQRAGKKVIKGDVPGAFIDAVDSALQYNVDLNEIVDGGYRLGYIMRLQKEGLEEAEIIRRVKLALFDPSTLTAAEDTFRKYIPFYTFAKKNLAFQMRNVFENPVQYSRFIKGVRSSWDAFGVDWEKDLQDYQKENLWLPIPLTMKDGKFYQLKTSFPVSDLGEFIENPAQKIFSALTPLVRAPIETTMNQQFFSGQPIERFRGQRGRMLGDLGFSARGEYLIGQTGIDRLLIPAASVIDLLKNEQATSFAPTVYTQGDVETARRSAAYDQLDELRDLFKFYKQEQIPILTLSEIENINKPRSTLAQRLQAIQRRRNKR